MRLTGMRRQQQTAAMTIGSHCKTSQQLVGAQRKSARWSSRCVPTDCAWLSVMCQVKGLVDHTSPLTDTQDL